MGRSSNYSQQILKDNQKYQNELIECHKLIKSQKLQIQLLEDENKSLKKKLEKYEIKIDIDSTNSSIPSSKNRFKTGITNSREKSNRTVGAQVGHKGNYVKKEVVENLFSNEETIKEVKEINLTEENKNKEPIIRYQLDFKIVPILTEIRIYPDKFGKYKIPKEYKSPITYGLYTKTFANYLKYESNVSGDNIKEIFKHFFAFNISKGTLINWERELEKGLRKETYNILKQLKNAKSIHADDTQINVDGKKYYIHNISTSTHTMQWAYPSKSGQAISEIGFLSEYNGDIIKDGTHVYDKFAKGKMASCGAHISRYLKGSQKGCIHSEAFRLLLFLNGLNKKRNRLKRKNAKSFTSKEIYNIYTQYLSILNAWNIQIIKDKDINPLYDEERKLCHRLKEDIEQHLLFVNDFTIPFTNNRAETDLRGVKSRQNVGIFRSDEAAERYATIRSNLSTYKKNKINLKDAILSAFSSNPILT